MPDTALITEESYLKLAAEIADMDARVEEFEAAAEQFIEDVNAQILQFAEDEDILMDAFVQEQEAKIAEYTSRMNSLVDTYETKVRNHILAWSPDQTHNGALDPAASFTFDQAPDRPYLSNFHTRYCSSIAGALLGDQKYKGYSGAAYADSIGYIVGNSSVQLQAPLATGKKTLQSVWCPTERIPWKTA